MEALFVPAYPARAQDGRCVIPSIAFDLVLAHGRCLGLHIPAAEADLDALAQAILLPEEQAHAKTLAHVRRRTWIGGRAAMHEAFARVGVAAYPMFSDDRGAPLLAAGIAGS